MNLFTSSQMPLDQYVTDRPWFVEGRTVPMDDQTCLPHRLEEVRSNLGDDVTTLYQARWGSIRSHFWETLRGVRSVYNFRTPIDCTMEDLKAFLRSVALRCTLPFKANIAVSSILRAKKPDDSGPDHPVLPWVRTERGTIRDTSNHHQGRGHGGHCLGHRSRADLWCPRRGIGGVELSGDDICSSVRTSPYTRRTDRQRDKSRHTAKSE